MTLNLNMLNKTMTKRQAYNLSPITLAFLGDCVYEVLVREWVIKNGDANAEKLHMRAVEFVRAKAQSQAVDIIEPLLTQEEADIYKRGRNSNNSTVPRSSNPKDYRRATGLEALFGYLHITGEGERMRELFEVICLEKQRSEENLG